jgi:hypothetical protein
VAKQIPPFATYAQRLIKCGKAHVGCRRCKVAAVHRTLSAYVGRVLPREVSDETLVTLVDGRRVTAGDARALV